MMLESILQVMKTCMIVEDDKHGPRAHLSKNKLNEWLNRLDMKDTKFVYSSISNLQDQSNYDIIIAVGNKVSCELKNREIEHFRLPHPGDFTRRHGSDSPAISRILRNCRTYVNEHPNKLASQI